ncbi:MAG: hypothetical protein IJS60_04915 [Abditibacteriota bacterium]|nr:hypothetical protein [Abditibacteriota bacterium]
MRKKTYIYQKDRFFARNNETAVTTRSEEVLGRKSEDNVRSYFVSRRLNVSVGKA